MKRWLPWGLVLLGLVLLFGSRWQQSKLRDRIAARDRSIAVLTSQADSLQHSLDTLAARADTLYTTRWLPSKLRIDTLQDTVKVPVEVVREVVRDADATIQACRVTVSECTKLAATEKARADSLDAQVKDWKRVSRGPLLTFAGYGASDLQGHLFVGAEAHVNILHISAFGRIESQVDSLAPTLRIGASIPF